MVDLQSQYQRIKQDIDNGIQEVIQSAAFIKGKKVTDFQHNLEQYTGAKHVIPVGNGTDALQIALMTLGLVEELEDVQKEEKSFFDQIYDFFYSILKGVVEVWGFYINAILGLFGIQLGE